MKTKLNALKRLHKMTLGGKFSKLGEDVCHKKS